MSRLTHCKKDWASGQTCSPDCDSLSIEPWEITDATAGVHRGARKRSSVAASSLSDLDWVSARR
jgi:hypothetical protein